MNSTRNDICIDTYPIEELSAKETEILKVEISDTPDSTKDQNNGSLMIIRISNHNDKKNTAIYNFDSEKRKKIYLLANEKLEVN